MLDACRNTPSSGDIMLPSSRLRSRVFGDLVIIVFLCAQILDGVFTYMGLQIFGPTIEANPLIASLMHTLGPVVALTLAKFAAMVFGAFLHLSAVHNVVATLTGLYLLLAIGPWTSLLFF
jgi:Domain of unknown function (DUF5658)